MTGAELREARERLKLTPTQAAASINVSARTWHRWEGEAKKTVPYAESRLFMIINKLEKV